MPALEAALLGLAVGDEKSVTLAPEDAYGLFDDTALREVPIDRVPENVRTVGAMVRVQGESGLTRIAEVRKETVVLDFNHPLAGKTLTFDVSIISVE